MKEEFKKFLELVKEDEALQKKLEEAQKSYTGDSAEEEVFNEIIVPIAKEAGCDISFDDLKSSVVELNPDEMAQVPGGETGGLGALACYGIGAGYGVNKNSTACWFFGFGEETTMACIREGYGKGGPGYN